MRRRCPCPWELGLWLGPSPAFSKEAVFPNLHSSLSVWVGHSGAVQLKFREPFGKYACAWDLHWGVISIVSSALVSAAGCSWMYWLFSFPTCSWKGNRGLVNLYLQQPAQGQHKVSACWILAEPMKICLKSSFTQEPVMYWEKKNYLHLWWCRGRGRFMQWGVFRVLPHRLWWLWYWM